MPGEPALDKLANHVPPRRAAARKASKLAAEQLESSPVPSDVENDGGGVSFGEPATPRSAVKVTYGGKRKYKQSPASKPSTSIAQAGPSHLRPRSKLLLEQSPTKKSSAGRGRGSSRGRGSQRAQKARRLSISSLSSSSVESPGRTTAPKPVEDPPRASGSHHTATTHSTKPSNNRNKADGTSSKKRPLSLSSSSEGGGSLLSPLSSPEAGKSPVTRQMPVLAPRLARQFMRSQTQAEIKISPAKKNTLKQSKSFDQLFALDSTDEESFDDYDIGSLVWVCIDFHGNLKDADDEDAETLWWPAKVSLPRPCMRVTLFGSPPGRTEPDARQLDIPSPSQSNVRSMRHNNRVRFSEATYRPSRRDGLQSSPRKKRKLDIDAAWRHARDCMLKEDGSYEGGDLLSHELTKAGPSSSKGGRRPNPFPSLNTRSGKGKGKAKRKGSDSDVSLSDLDDGVDDEVGSASRRGESTWHPPSANPLLELPGELVLAREGRARTQYWPAKLLEYIPPKNARQRPRYKALFFDGTKLSIEPDWFWTTADEEFATCNLGESTGNYGLDSDIDASDDENGPENFNKPFAPEDEAALRAPSPLPTLPAPAPEVFEYDMEISEEFEYVKPVLAAMIEGQYAPARARHEGFMRGAGARQKVLDAVPLRGSLSAREKEEVAYLVRSWARRRERRRELGLSIDYPPDKLYPPDEGGPQPVSGARSAVREVNGRGVGGGDDDGGDSDGDSVLTPASDISEGDTEPLGPFEMEPPPSSFTATETDVSAGILPPCVSGMAAHARAYARPVEAVDGALMSDDLQLAVSAGPSSASTTAEPPTADTEVRPEDGKTAATDVSFGADRPPAAEETDAPRAPPKTTFHDLDAVEKITYCDNVLLQEAILQMLLWRTGQRKALGLLSPEEEERLHAAALEEGEKTNWVHDIIRLRQAAEHTMLPSGKGADKGKGKGKEKAGDTRARTRRAG
ncbi:hypothetical protein C8Q77DRAFT_1215574 [Trametes polyzona]|nr:hypothetical protein C8Q77DRAFT_1215574 [Trametes polyzona]